MVIEQWDVWLSELDPTRGSEIKKTRPCLVVSPDEANDYLHTVLIAPLTSVRKGYMTRVKCTFQGRDGEIALDQMRCLDKSRLIKKLGTLSSINSSQVSQRLVKLFS